MNTYTIGRCTYKVCNPANQAKINQLESLIQSGKVSKWAPKPRVSKGTRKYPQFGRFETTRDYVRQYYELNQIDGRTNYGEIIEAFFEPLPNRPFPQNIGPDGLMEAIDE